MHKENDGSATQGDVTAATDPLYRTTWKGEHSLHETVLDGVAEVSDRTRSDLDPLHDYVDAGRVTSDSHCILVRPRSPIGGGLVRRSAAISPLDVHEVIRSPVSVGDSWVRIRTDC